MTVLKENNYLIFVDEHTSYDFVQRILCSFSEKAFLTNYTMTIVVNSMDTYREYVFSWRLRMSHAVKIIIKISTDYHNILKGATHLLITETAHTIEIIDKAYELGLELVAEGDAEALLTTISRNEEQKIVYRQLEEMIDKEVMKAYPPYQWEFFLFGSMGMGETIILSTIFNDYQARHDRKIFVLATSKPCIDIMSVTPGVECTGSISPLIYDYFCTYRNRYGVVRFPWEGISTQGYKHTNHLLFTGNHGYADTWRDYLSLGGDYEYHKKTITIPKQAVEKADSVMNSMSLTRGRTVLLATDGNSFPLQEQDLPFWSDLAKVLQKNGFDVITNRARLEIPGVRSIFLSVLESSALLGKCGIVVTMPTGFIEACCGLNTRENIYCCRLWPASNNPVWRLKPEVWQWARMPLVRTYGSKFVQKFKADFSNMHKAIWGENIKRDDIILTDMVENKDEIIKCILNKLLVSCKMKLNS